MPQLSGNEPILGLNILSQHQVVFQPPQGIPPSEGVHDHSIPLVSRSIPPNVIP